MCQSINRATAQLVHRYFFRMIVLCRFKNILPLSNNALVTHRYGLLHYTVLLRETNLFRYIRMLLLLKLQVFICPQLHRVFLDQIVNVSLVNLEPHELAKRHSSRLLVLQTQTFRSLGYAVRTRFRTCRIKCSPFTLPYHTDDFLAVNNAVMFLVKPHKELDLYC